MLDENLPTFYLKSSGRQKHLWTVYLCHHGNEPAPAYTLRYPDPSSPSSKNRYAVALCDPYVPDVIYGEVLLIPEWTQPSLSAEAIRQNGGVTPPPEPVLPSKFIVNLYNPDQQIVVRYKPKTWNTPATWDFDMPQHTFRQPSSSTLDRTQIDPSVADVTPKLRFSWRKDSKLSKDLACLLSGKTAMGPETKTKSKEPDITISIFKSLREMTLYEPNLYRVEMEDFKGLEVVLLLGAVTIRDVWFASVKDAFRVDHSVRKAAASAPAVGGGVQKPAQSVQRPVQPVQKPATTPAAVNGHRPQPQPEPVTASGALNATRPRPERPEPPRISIPQRESRPIPQVQPGPGAGPGHGPGPAPGPSAEAESHNQEPRRQKKHQEADEKAKRKRQAEVEKETKRLQRIYGREEEQVRRLQRPAPQHQQPQRPVQQRPPPHQTRPSYPPRPNLPPRPAPVPVQAPVPSPYLQVPNQHARHSSVQFLPMQHARPYSMGMRPAQPPPGAKVQQKKSSFFGLRRSTEDKDKLHKKRSSMF